MGISASSDRPAHSVPAFLQARGYRIMPVSATVPEVLGEKSAPDLRALPERPDLVMIFTPGEVVASLVEDAIAIGARTVWMQDGVVHAAAAARARDAGLDVVMDTCLRFTWERLMSVKPGAGSRSGARQSQR